DLEDVGLVAARRVHLAVANPGFSGDALELAGVDDARPSHRILVRERALAHVGDDLGAVLRAARDARAGTKLVFVEGFESSESIRPVTGVEGEPDILLPALVVVAVARL